MSGKVITLIDYGIGNVYSVSRAFESVGASVDLTSDPDRIRNAERLVLPGVGAFGDGMAELKNRGLFEPILEYSKRARPFMGMCVGMQLMFEKGLEFGEHTGLGLIPGTVEKIENKTTDGYRLKVPHIGWNALRRISGRSSIDWKNTVLQSIPELSAVYFVHSFSARTKNPENVLAEVEYGGHRIVAAVREGPWTGCQFHPERSGPIGLEIIRSFAEFRN